MKRKKLISIVAAGMVFFLILTLILSLIPATVFAASSSEIQEELNSLESQAQEIQQAKKTNWLSSKPAMPRIPGT